MKNRAVVGGLATLVVVALVVAGMFAIGSPATARKYKADQERRNRITQLHYVLSSQVRAEGSLPASLEAIDSEILRRAGYTADVRKDPQTGENFEYRRTGDRTYEVCADFETSSDDRRAGEYRPYPGDVEHNEGRNCYDRTVTNQDVVTAPDFRESGELPLRELPAEDRRTRSQQESPPDGSASPAAAVEDY
ncbi:MAG TPA: hypothetical protein VHI31_06490 [Actinomycetota bacterium]|nr:hypothetical protein [Actinomycetota bacterium]